MLPTLSTEDRAELQFCDEGTCGHCDHYAIRVAALLERHTLSARVGALEGAAADIDTHEPATAAWLRDLAQKGATL